MESNVINMTIGIIVGAAFGKTVTSPVNDITVAPLGQALGGDGVSGLFGIKVGPL